MCLRRFFMCRNNLIQIINKEMNDNKAKLVLS